MLASKEKMIIDEEIFPPEILRDLSEASQKKTCFCSYPVFKWFYRIAEQESRPGYLMLCTLTNKNGRPPADKKAEEWSKRLNEAIEAAIPRWGAACRCSKGQYLLLLIGAEKEECEELERRIEASFLESCSEESIQWEINRVNQTAFAGQERRRFGMLNDI